MRITREGRLSLRITRAGRLSLPARSCLAHCIGRSEITYLTEFMRGLMLDRLTFAAAGGTEVDATRTFDTIRTDRLLMRRWRESDRDPFAALNSDPETMRYLLGTLDRAESDAFVDRIESRFREQGYGLW